MSTTLAVGPAFACTGTADKGKEKVDPREEQRHTVNEGPEPDPPTTALPVEDPPPPAVKEPPEPPNKDPRSKYVNLAHEPEPAPEPEAEPKPGTAD